MQCWCGNLNLDPFGEGYHRCAACQTLLSDATDAGFNPRVMDESSDLYGREYWFGHQTQDLNCPDIVTRSRSDLAERAIHWLRSLLRFRLPPARVLELGCAHGGFVAMLRQAGFDALGLELSPCIVEFARQTFGIEVLTGPIEDQAIAPRSLDVIVMMDVMEHLADPLRTLGRCLELIEDDGLLLIQTPSYPEGKSLEELRSIGHKFPQMLDPREHLYLFSPASVRELFHRLGADHIVFIPAIFDFYDMSFVVSRKPLAEIPMAAREAALMTTNPGRMLQALIDLDARRLDLLEKYRLVLRNEK
jgi:SAM-dependent methyltransferase